MGCIRRWRRTEQIGTEASVVTASFTVPRADAGTAGDSQSVPVLSGGSGAAAAPAQPSAADAAAQSVSTGTGGGALGVLAGNAFGPSKDLDPKSSASLVCTPLSCTMRRAPKDSLRDLQGPPANLDLWTKNMRTLLMCMVLAMVLIRVLGIGRAASLWAEAAAQWVSGVRQGGLWRKFHSFRGC